jgi:hypothetical protein
MRNRIHRWRHTDERWGHRYVETSESGSYHLTAAGARRADAMTTVLRRLFTGLARI